MTRRRAHAAQHELHAVHRNGQPIGEFPLRWNAMICKLLCTCNIEQAAKLTTKQASLLGSSRRKLLLCTTEQAVLCSEVLPKCALFGEFLR
jgi:hypothetical protein